MESENSSSPVRFRSRPLTVPTTAAKSTGIRGIEIHGLDGPEEIDGEYYVFGWKQHLKWLPTDRL